MILIVSMMLAGVGLTGCTGGTTGAQDTLTCTYNATDTAAKPVDPPSDTNVPSKGTVTATMHMDAGDVVMDLTRETAPCAVHSFESLASQKYFDDTSCHRLVANFVLQCGDPTGTGTGGPGYKYADELTGEETYPYGTVAMANAGPDTNGSQFFIVIGENVQLPPSYSILGTVHPDSMAVVESIAAQGIDPTDPRGITPAEGGHISSVTLS